MDRPDQVMADIRDKIRGDELAATKAKLAKARQALEAIAACESHTSGDCPDLAATVLKEIDNG